MTSEMPLVSVVMASYNCADYIGAAIDSALAQTYPHREIIVVDGSTDATKDRVRPYTDRIQFHYQEPRGVSAARNAGMRLARGEIVAFLDADDLWMPEKLERQVTALRDHPEVGLIFTEGVEIDEAGAVQKDTLLPTTPGSFYHWLPQYGDPWRGWVKGRWFARLVKATFIRVVSQVAVRRECLEAVGEFNESLKTAEDGELWLRIAHRYPLLFLPAKLTQYRRRTDGLSGQMDGRQDRWDAAEATMFAGLLDRFGAEERRLIQKRLVFLYRKLGWNRLYWNRPDEARALLRRCLEHGPWDGRGWVYLAASYMPASLLDGWRRRQLLSSSVGRR